MTSEASAYQELPQVTLGNNQSFSALTATNSANIIAGNVRDVNIHTSSDAFLSTLPNASNANFNAYQRQHDPICLKNTRVALLRDIYTWADGQDERYIFWLNGLAGTGKSTIARTVARKYFEQDRLGASFFFSQNDGNVGHAGNFVTSIASQLASSVPSLGQHIDDAIKKRPNIAAQSLPDQWQHLVVLPLSKLNESSGPFPYILVVDALDECDNEDDVCLMVQFLAKAHSQTPLLRVFLTSRSETSLRIGFGELSTDQLRNFVLHKISPRIVDKDISLFLKDKFRLIVLQHALSVDWPGTKIIEQFVRIAGGLFIWAATAYRYIRDSPYPDESVQTLLDRSTLATAPEEHLNELYTSVLRRSIRPCYSAIQKERLCERLRLILGSIIVLLAPLNASSLRKLLDVTPDMINPTLKDLHAILDLHEADAYPIQLHHPSFRDFLVDPKRCVDRDFLVHEEESHQVLADKCIQLMKGSLKQDICSSDAPGMLVANVDAKCIEQSLSPEFRYACYYWTEHVQRSGAQLCDNGWVHGFLQKHFLHWLEALGWLGKISISIHAMTALESFVSSDGSPELWRFIHDAKRFVLYSRAAIEQAPLQTYVSALAFAPTSSIIRQTFAPCTLRWLQRLPKIDNVWSTTLQVLDSHRSSVNAVTFSPDGKMLASASEDKTTKVWDVASGALVQTLNGHHSPVKTCSFLANGTSLITTAKGDVRVWNSITGKLLLESEVPARKPLSKSQRKAIMLGIDRTAIDTITISSPNGKLSASRSDQTVTLVQKETGAELCRLNNKDRWHPYGIMVFSQDSEMLAVESLSTLTFWKVSTGTLIHAIPRRIKELKLTNATSSDGKLRADVSNSKIVKLWKVVPGGSSRSLEGHSCAVTAIDFSPDSKLLASASLDGTVRLWDTSTKPGLPTLDAHWDYVSSLKFSPNGRFLASAANDCTVKLWDVDKQALHRTFISRSGRVCHIAFSPDSKLLALASTDCTITVRWAYQVTEGTVAESLKGHSTPVTAIYFSQDSMTLASKSSGGEVKLWDTVMGKELKMSASECDMAFMTFKGTYGAQNLPSPSISFEGHWVLRCNKRILWLPLEHRPSVSTILEDKVGFGYGSGRVIIIDLAP